MGTCNCTLAGTRACENCPNGPGAPTLVSSWPWPDPTNAEIARLKARVADLEALVAKLSSDLDIERGRVEGMRGIVAVHQYPDAEAGVTTATPEPATGLVWADGPGAGLIR